jgi:hypothetical protein
MGLSGPYDGNSCRRLTSTEGQASHTDAIQATSDDVEALGDEALVNLSPGEPGSDVDRPRVFVKDDFPESGHGYVYAFGRRKARVGRMSATLDRKRHARLADLLELKKKKKKKKVGIGKSVRETKGERERMILRLCQHRSGYPVPRYKRALESSNWPSAKCPSRNFVTLGKNKFRANRDDERTTASKVEHDSTWVKHLGRGRDGLGDILARDLVVVVRGR